MRRLFEGGYYFASLFVRFHISFNQSTGTAILLRPVVLLCDLPYASTSTSPGASPSLSFNFSLNVTSNVLYFSTVAAASLIPRLFSTILPLEGLGLGTRLGSSHSQSFASCPRDPDDYELMRLLLCFALG